MFEMYETDDLKQACRRLMGSSRATYCLRALHWWPLMYSVLQLETQTTKKQTATASDAQMLNNEQIVCDRKWGREDTMATPSSSKKHMSSRHVAFPSTYINQRVEAEFGRYRAGLREFHELNGDQKF